MLLEVSAVVIDYQKRRIIQPKVSYVTAAHTHHCAQLGHCLALHRCAHPAFALRLSALNTREAESGDECQHSYAMHCYRGPPDLTGCFLIESTTCLPHPLM